MSAPHDPIRLIDNPSDPQLAALLRVTRGDRPDAATIDALAQCVELTALSATTSGASTGWLGTAGKLKLIKLLAVLTASGGALWLAADRMTAAPGPTRHDPTTYATGTLGSTATPSLGAAPATTDSAQAASTQRTKPAIDGEADGLRPGVAAQDGSHGHVAAEASAAAASDAPAVGAQHADEVAASRHTRDAAARGTGPSTRPHTLRSVVQRVGVPGTATREPSSGAPTTPTTARRGAEPAQTSGPTELSLLTEAQRALKHDPSRTLALSREHQRAYPSGAFAEERDALMIDALARLGHATEARRLAVRFLDYYPRSPHHAHITTVLQALR